MATTLINTLSLHDALPISVCDNGLMQSLGSSSSASNDTTARGRFSMLRISGPGLLRSEEHTSELQSRRDLVCRLLLEKKYDRQAEPAHARYSCTLPGRYRK